MISNGQASLLDVFVCNGSRCCAGSASRDPRQVGCGTGLPTSAISCWGTKDASRIIGTEIRYTAHSLAWEGYFVAGPSVSQRAVTAEQFQRENSGQGTTSSQVSFRTLGIRSAKVKQVQLGHPPADITGATTEIPGDKVLLKNKNKIVFSVCNVFFAGETRAGFQRFHAVAVRKAVIVNLVPEQVRIPYDKAMYASNPLILSRRCYFSTPPR